MDTGLIMKKEYKHYDILCVILLLFLLLAFAYIGAWSAQAEIGKNPYDSSDTVIYVFNEHEQLEMEKYFEAYCNEIDSLCYSYGFEIDADRIDILNDVEMEEEAYRLLGDKFYTWRQRESKYAWIRDVYIARYAY